MTFFLAKLTSEASNVSFCCKFKMTFNIVHFFILFTELKNEFVPHIELRLLSGMLMA